MKLLSIMLALSLGACGPTSSSTTPPPPPTHAPTTPPVSPPSTSPVTIEGKLISGIAAIGAETTGWVIEQQQTTDGMLRTEIDCVSVLKEAEALDGKQVRAHGRWEERKYVERGAIRVLIVERIEAMP